MAEYINREAVLNELQEELNFETSMYTEEQNKYFNMGLKCAKRNIERQPTADVVDKKVAELLEKQLKERVEVVRCCECIHRKENPDIYNTCYLTCNLKHGLQGTIDPTDFCSYGERKDGVKE